MFVELHDKDTGQAFFVNFGFVEYFREVDRKGEKYTLVVLRDIEELEELGGLNRYNVAESPHEIMSDLREAVRK